MSAPSDAESTSLSSQHSPDTEVTKRLSNSLSLEHFHHPLSPVYSTIAPPSLPLTPALPMIAPSSFPLNQPVSPEYRSISPLSFAFHFPVSPSLAVPYFPGSLTEIPHRRTSFA